MSRKRHPIAAKFRYHRAILSDMLPFEVPATFSNGGFFSFLATYDVRFVSEQGARWVRWEADSDAIDLLIRVLFGVHKDTQAVPDEFDEFVRGKLRKFRKVRVSSNWTKPFNFDVSHREKDFRRLSVVHPRTQL